MPTNNNGPGDVKPVLLAKQYPLATETKARAINKQYLRLMQTAVKESMPEIMAAVRAERNESSTIRTDGISDLAEIVRRAFRKVKERFARYVVDFGAEEQYRDAGASTNEWSKRQWRNTIRQTLGVDIRDDYFSGEIYDQLVHEWAAENVQKITSISDQALDQMQEVITKDFMQGKAPTSIASDIQGRYSVSRSKATMLARDQVGTLNAEITKTQQTTCGVRKYQWSSSGDERVRACHAELDGRIISWDDPPEMWYETKSGIVYTGRHCHPGEDYECRCVALPVFDDEDDLNDDAFVSGRG